MNLLITGAWLGAKEKIEAIEKMGHTVRFMQYEKEELPCDYRWVEGVVCNGLFLNHPINKFVNLRFIQLTSAGMERIPMDYVSEYEIQIYNAKGVYSIPMAEFAITGVLNLYKKMQFFYEAQKEHKWEKQRDLLELSDKTVCIVGCGSVGTECAKRFQAFGCYVIGVDLYPREDEHYCKMVPLNMLNDLVKGVDIIILTLPLTKETTYLINEDLLKRMKKGVVLINIARGGIIDTQALLGNLDKMGGVVLDVFEEEPLNRDHLLWNKDNVIITPHNSFVGEHNQERLNRLVIRNIKCRGTI